MTRERPFLPYGRQHIDDKDIAAVTQVLRSDYLTTGPEVEKFEAAAAEATGARFAVACNSGTAALHLAVMGLGLGPDDAAVVPSITFVATANIAVHQGARVVFADVDPDTGLMTPDTLEEAIARAGNPVPKIALPVHLAGRVCDMAALHAVADRHGLSLVEDACHALGGAYHNGSRRVGDCHYADAATFSLHPVKTVAMGEGGFVSTNDHAVATRARQMREHGLTRDSALFTQNDLAFEDGASNPWYYEMPSPGFNYRAPDLACALGRSQLAKLDRFVSHRRALMARYAELLPALEPVVRFPAADAADGTAWHLCAVQIDFDAIGRTRAAVMTALRESGIGSQVHYIPVHRQPWYRKADPELDLPGADSYYARTLSLPLFVDMTAADVERVVAALGLACGIAA